MHITSLIVRLTSIYSFGREFSDKYRNGSAEGPDTGTSGVQLYSR